MRTLYSKADILSIVLAPATTGVWLYDHFTKNIQYTEVDVIVLLAILLGSFTYLRLFRKFGLLHSVVSLALLILSVIYFCWSLFSFSFYGFNGATLPLYAYALLTFNLLYITLSFYDGVMQKNKKSYFRK